MKQSDNRVYIQGILSEVDIKQDTFQRDGVPMKFRAGSVKIKVNLPEKELIVPVHLFAAEYKKNGERFSAYDALGELQNEFVSIAAAGNEVDADRVRVVGELRMNEFMSNNGVWISGPRVHTMFVSKIPKNECEPEATFSLEAVMGAKKPELDSEGMATGRLEITGIVTDYRGEVDVFTLVSENENVGSAIDLNWTEGGTYVMGGILDFTSEVIVEEIPQDFGDPVERKRTVRKEDLVITRGATSEFQYDADEIKKALAARKARIDAAKAKGPAQRNVPPAGSGTNHLGF